MRKKYLSALLFGALLVTSAGTFTSCKDYDDDINNLQGQIDEIKTTLSELEKQVGTAGVSSVTFDEATGVLTVVDASGTPKTYKIQTSAEAKVEATISEDGILTINGEEIGKVRDGGDTVTVDGDKLLVNGDVVATIPSGNYVTMVKDEANKTVTLKYGDETVTLPYGADASVTPSVEFEETATNKGKWDVAWGVAAGDITFGDATYKTGDLLLGGMTQFAEVTVKPITYDLSAQTLKLVDIDGNYAKVKVVPSTTEPTGTTSRAMISNDGKWNLSLVMDETVTEENIATAFTKKVNGVDQNLMYALTVNGTRVTGYNFVIDTQTKNESDVNTAIEDGELGAVSSSGNYDGYIAKVNAGEISMQLGQFVSVANKTATDIAEFDFNEADLTVLNASNIVASYFEVTDVNAEAAGIKADGMTLTIPASATGKVYDLKLNVLDVTGAKTSHLVKIVVGASEISTVDKVSQVDFTITASDNKITVPFGEIFSKIDANTALQIKGYKLTTADKNFFALSDLTADDNDNYEVVNGTNGSIAFYSDAKYEKPVAIDGTADKRTILGAKINLYNNGTYYQTGADKFENIYGAFELKLTLTDANGNALKNIVIPVKVSAPEFSDLYKKNTYAGWDADGAITTVLNATDVTAPDFDKLFVKAADGKPIPAGVSATFKYNYKNNNKGSAEDHDNVTLTEICKDGDTGTFDIAVSSVTVKVENEVAKVQLSDASTQKPVNVNTSFTMKLVSQYSAAKLVYYKDNVALDKAIVGNDNTIAAYDQTNSDDTDATPLYTGLALVYGTEKPVPFKWYTSTIDEDATSNNFDLIAVSTLPNDKSTTDQVEYSIDLTDTSIGQISWSQESFGGLVKVDELVKGQGGTLKVTFVDDLGVKSYATIDYIKE